MKLSQFQFVLPAEKIASEPPRWRDECKLMVLNKKTGEIEHKLFKDILDYFEKGGPPQGGAAAHCEQIETTCAERGRQRYF